MGWIVATLCGMALFAPIFIWAVCSIFQDHEDLENNRYKPKKPKIKWED